MREFGDALDVRLALRKRNGLGARRSSKRCHYRSEHDSVRKHVDVIHRGTF
jgi:hypothetical protein